MRLRRRKGAKTKNRSGNRKVVWSSETETYLPNPPSPRPERNLGRLRSRGPPSENTGASVLPATPFEEALPTTEVLIDSIPDDLFPYKIIKTYPDKSALISLPRYNKFNTAIRFLASINVGFKEIAGNNSAILLSVLVPSDKNLTYENTQTLFTQPFSSEPTIKRIVIATPVSNLKRLLRELDSDLIQVEHVFDF